MNPYWRLKRDGYKRYVESRIKLMVINLIWKANVKEDNLLSF